MEGKLKLQGQWAGSRIVYHVSCYLGRYNQVYDGPRQILRSLPGLELAELKRSRERGLRCGGRGGSMWMEHEAGHRVNDLRMEEIEALSPDLAAAACPYCLIMLAEAASSRDDDAAVPLKDMAEVIAGVL